MEIPQKCEKPRNERKKNVKMLGTEFVFKPSHAESSDSLKDISSSVYIFITLAFS